MAAAAAAAREQGLVRPLLVLAASAGGATAGLVQPSQQTGLTAWQAAAVAFRLMGRFRIFPALGATDS
jgi:hypothetical protein